MIDLLVWAVPAVVLVVGLWRPRDGLLVLAACLPFFGSPPGGPYLAALDVAGLAAIATAWRAGRAPASRLDWPVGAFVAMSVASLLPVAYQPPSWQPGVLLGLLRVFPGVESWTILYTWRAVANLLLGWGLYVAVKTTFAGRSLRPLGLALAAGLAPVVGLGLAEHVGLIDLGAYRAIGGGVWKTRLHSVFFHSGWLAEYLVLSAPVALAALVGAGRRARQLGVLLFGGVLVTILFTQQRGAWLSVTAQFALLTVLWLPRPFGRGLWLRQLVVGCLVALIVIGTIVVLNPSTISPLVERAKSATSDLSGRGRVWRSTVEMIEERPLLGWGLGSYSSVYDRERATKSPTPRFMWLTAHNHYLMIAAERGLAGLAVFGLMVWSWLVALRRGLRGEDAEDRRMSGGLLLSLFGLLTYGLVQYLFYLKSIEWLIWILLGAVAVISGSSPDPKKRTSDRVARAICLGALLLVPWRLIAVESADLRGNRRYGFHWRERSGERNMEWTEGHAARRIAWKGETLVLSLANGHPRAREHPVRVVVGVNGRPAGVFVVRGGWEEHRFVVGPPQSEWLVLSLEADPTFRPFSEFRRYPDLEPSSDIRLLGVAVGDIRWEERERTGSTVGFHRSAGWPRTFVRFWLLS